MTDYQNDYLTYYENKFKNNNYYLGSFPILLVRGQDGIIINTHKMLKCEEIIFTILLLLFFF